MTQLRVRARAVDMLGRQQIAGIPTAIHELFKNAHDAYADRVEVDFFRRSRVLIIRDDGYGMTRDDLESRWLTLGTESRVGSNKSNAVRESWDDLIAGPRRVMMGEKGIGRLAIAVIAPITILLSRAKRSDGLKPLVVAIVHWGMYEQPGLDIDEINIPIREFPEGTLPDREQINSLVNEISENLSLLKNKISVEHFQQLTNDLDRARAIAPDIIDRNFCSQSANGLSLSGDGFGTHFILLPVAPELDDDIDGGADKESSKLERNLLGFSNTMALLDPPIKTEFRDHNDDIVVDRIGSKSFFTSDDFSKTDQLFQGEFDEYGQFVGTVTIYGKARKFVCNWVDGKGARTRCGPFSFRYGYVQGDSKETSLSPDDWTYMDKKTTRIGGVYMYRDGIRVLPYGNSDYDWLDIEKRRTLAAKDWFFSYRRGFGYVAITHQENSSLTEKAGREGFRENQAYRDFRAILVNFFRQLALEFFRRSSPQGEDYWAGKEEYSLQAELLKKQKEKSDNRRRDFSKELSRFFDLYGSGYFEEQCSSIKSYLDDRLTSYGAELDLGDYVTKVRLLELDAKQRANQLFNSASVSLPRGLALTKKLKNDWAAYISIHAQLQEDLFSPLRTDIDKSILDATNGRVALSERRSLALQDIERERDSTLRRLITLRKEAADATDVLQGAMRDVLQEQFSHLRAELETEINGFAKKSAEDPSAMEQAKYELEQKIQATTSREIELYASLKRQMLELAEGVRERETLDDRFAALEARNQMLEEQVEFYSDFAQMGMSVGVLQHEFESAARGIRVSMAELKPWADRNPPLAVIYKGLREHIDHLDGYLKVLDPLGRRLHRATVSISGDEILTVLRRVFSRDLAESGIQLEPTLEFRQNKLECRSSALLGAFINVVDNAIYWLNNKAQTEKIIRLGACDGGFTISNNGPQIEERFRNQIFEFGETTKPGGRGMGLAISRENLKREGFNIELSPGGGDDWPEFRIWKIEQGEEE